MRKPFWFYCETYLENIYFLPAFNQDQINSFFKKKDIDKPFKVKSNMGMTVTRKQGIIIWVKDNKRTNQNLSDLHHECIHAASYILHDRGVKASFSNDEAQAYLSQFIFSKCVKHLK